MKWLLCLSVFVWLSAQAGPQTDPPSVADLIASAISDYRAGNYEQALAQILERWPLQEEVARPTDIAPQVRLNAALCALRLLRSRDAELFVQPLLEHDERGADAAFLMALASCQHAERAVVAANLADAEPMAWEMATRAIKNAELQFRQACHKRPGWSPAVRNLERTIRRRMEIESDRANSQPAEPKKEDAPETDPPDRPSDPEQPPQVVIPEIAMDQLTQKELLALQKRVREQQDKKLRLRRQRSGARRVAGDRDW